jgi:hypothetical protein
MRTWDKQGDGLITYEEFEDYYKVTDAAPAGHPFPLAACILRYAALRWRTPHEHHERLLPPLTIHHASSRLVTT